MKSKIELALTKALGSIWMVIFSIATVTSLVAIVKVLLYLLGVI